MKNDTDYVFPEWWGMASRLPDEQEWEIKSDWFMRQRVYRQASRQNDTGMWDQWDDVSRGDSADEYKIDEELE